MFCFGLVSAMMFDGLRLEITTLQESTIYRVLEFLNRFFGWVGV